MNSLPGDLLRQFLKEYFTYREQYTLLQVCAKWCQFITETPVGWKDAFKTLQISILSIDNMAPASIRKKQITEIYKLLTQSVYSPLFIKQESNRRFRNTVIQQLSNHYGGSYLLDDAIIHLCNRIDSASAILSHGCDRYWTRVRKETHYNSGLSDISYEQFTLLEIN